jgi:hypothetical protein
LSPSVPRALRFLLVSLLAALAVATIAPTHAYAKGFGTGLRPLWVGIGGAGGGELGEPVGAGYGSLTIGLRLIPIVPEVMIREGVSGDATTLRQHHGSIALGARVLLPPLGIVRPHLRLAFSHRHDAPLAIFKSQPFKVLFGTAEGITHRSGVETGGGLEISFGKVMGLWAQGTLVVLPTEGHNPVSGLWELGVSFAIGPPHP